MTIHAVTTLSSNRADEVTGYVGNLSPALWRVLGSNPNVRRVDSVDAVPYGLVKPRGALDLVSAASVAGLVWHVSPRVGYPAEWVDLRVYDVSGRTLFSVAWEDGKAVKGHGYVSVAEAKRLVESAEGYE